MKAISLFQPWASLVILGAKRYETRTWQTLYRGPLVIHACRRIPEELRGLCGREPFRRVLRGAGFASWFDLPLGALLGTVELVDCRLVDEVPAGNELERALRTYHTGRWAWQLERPQALPQAVPWRGTRGLFEVPVDLDRSSPLLVEAAS